MDKRPKLKTIFVSICIFQVQDIPEKNQFQILLYWAIFLGLL